jgi:hypothetical protein
MLMIGPNEEAPLQILPYFKFLNEFAQFSLMRQLIEKFQGTSFTPRNYVLMPTPRLDFVRAQSSSSYEEDPHCFDAFSPRAMNFGAGSVSTSVRSSNKGTRAEDGKESRLKQSEGAAIEAAIAVALQVASGSISAEQLLALLLGISGAAAVASGGPAGEGNKEMTTDNDADDKSI